MEQMWGGMLTGVAFDPTTHTCILNVAVTDADTTSAHVVECRTVQEMRFFSEIPEPWTYAELTEVHGTFDRAAGSWLLELMLWSEDAGLIIRCADLYLDSQVLSTAPGPPGGGATSA